MASISLVTLIARRVAVRCALSRRFDFEGEDFVGASAVSAVNCVMLKRGLPAVIVLLCFCSPLAAEPVGDARRVITSDGLRIIDDTEVAPALTLERRDLFSTVDDGVLLQSLQAMTVLDPWRLPTLRERGRSARPAKNYRVGLLSAIEGKKRIWLSSRLSSHMPIGSSR